MSDRLDEAVHEPTCYCDECLSRARGPVSRQTFAAGPWISVSERLPELDLHEVCAASQNVLFVTRAGAIQIGYVCQFLDPQPDEEGLVWHQDGRDGETHAPGDVLWWAPLTPPTNTGGEK